VGILIISLASYAGMMNGRDGNGGPYGNYCSRGWSGRYGSRIAVKTKKEAMKIVREYYKSNSQLHIHISEEGSLYFKVEIRNEKDNLKDVVIIDKRTGRLRSIY